MSSSKKLLLSKSLKFKFVLIFVVFIFVSCLLISLIASLSILNTGERIAEQQGVPAVIKVSEIIDGDKFENLVRTLDKNDPFYEETRLQMLEIAKTVGAKYLYTMAPRVSSVATNTFLYIIDGSCDPSDTENFSDLGDEDDLTSWGDAPFDAYKTGGVTVSGLDLQDEWGWSFSSFAAIKNSKGRVVGIVGCDYDATFLVQTIINNLIFVLAASAVFIVVGIAIILFFTKAIFGTMADISRAMKTISTGNADLTQRIPIKNDDELGMLAENCNNVIKRLADLFEDLQTETGALSKTESQLFEHINDSAEHIDSAADAVVEIDSTIKAQHNQISSVAEGIRRVEGEIDNLESRLEEQSQAVGSSSAAVEQISANIKAMDSSVSKITEQYSALMADSKKGRETQRSANEQITQIAEQSKNLTQANAVIENIAAQTNLLAMNAAIEAAHAGEAGKGFAVVANEIRTLATNSSKQSGAIKTLLEGISDSIGAIVESSNTSLQAFSNVNEKIRQIDNIIGDIKSGMEEENVGIENILERMNALSQTTDAITQATRNIKDTTSSVSQDVRSLEDTASLTREKSLSVTESMDNLKSKTVKIIQANNKNTESSRAIIEMIDGYKVKA